MLIDFFAKQLQEFDALAEQIVASPKDYLQFESVSDFYKVSWLNDFPKGTVWYATGLDDGAEDFDARIEYRNRYLLIEIREQIKVQYGVTQK